MDKQYTPWRRFLAVIGFITIWAWVGLIIFLLVADIPQICIYKV